MDSPGATLGIIGVLCAAFIAHQHYEPKLEEAQVQVKRLQQEVEFLAREKELTRAQLEGALMRK